MFGKKIKNVGIVCNDAGSANIIVNWIRVYRYNYFIKTQGPAKKIFKRILPKVNVNIGLRNIISHAYDSVEPEMLWGIIHRNIPVLADEIRTVQEQTGIIALKFEEEKAQATKLFQKLETSVHNYHDRLFGVEIENVNTVSTSHT